MTWTLLSLVLYYFTSKQRWKRRLFGSGHLSAGCFQMPAWHYDEFLKLYSKNSSLRFPSVFSTAYKDSNNAYILSFKTTTISPLLLTLIFLRRKKMNVATHTPIRAYILHVFLGSQVAWKPENPENKIHWFYQEMNQEKF